MKINWRKALLSFLSKYFFILKAAAEGWRIAYQGGNKFVFYHNKQGVTSQLCTSPRDFIDRYIYLFTAFN
jgi:hypothetical protein